MNGKIPNTFVDIMTAVAIVLAVAAMFAIVRLDMNTNKNRIPLYETDYYYVYTTDDESGYYVQNKHTGVYELETKELPKCLIYASSGSKILDEFDWSEDEEVH